MFANALPERRQNIVEFSEFDTSVNIFFRFVINRALCCLLQNVGAACSPEICAFTPIFNGGLAHNRELAVALATAIIDWTSSSVML